MSNIEDNNIGNNNIRNSNIRNNNIEASNKENNKKEAGDASPASRKKMTSKQIVAIAGIVLLVLMYVATLIAAVFDSTASGRLFWICLFSTVAIPLLIWIYTWMYGILTRKHTFADLDLGGEKENSREEQ